MSLSTLTPFAWESSPSGATLSSAQAAADHQGHAARPPVPFLPDQVSFPTAGHARRCHRGRRSAGALQRRLDARNRAVDNSVLIETEQSPNGEVPLADVSPQGIGSADSEPIVPSRKTALFHSIILDHVNVRGFVRHKC